MGCWRNIGLLVIGCVIRTAGKLCRPAYLNRKIEIPCFVYILSCSWYLIFMYYDSIRSIKFEFTIYLSSYIIILVDYHYIKCAMWDRCFTGDCFQSMLANARSTDYTRLNWFPCAYTIDMLDQLLLFINKIFNFGLIIFNSNWSF